MLCNFRLVINCMFPISRKRRRKAKKKAKVTLMVKLVMLGACGVGKTNIVHRYVHDEFSYNHEPTIEDVYEKCFDWKSKKETIFFYIYDTAGSNQFPAMQRLAISQSQAFVVVYAVDNRESFEEAKKICAQVLDLKGTVKSIIMVGNKCDLPKSKQTVSSEEASMAAYSMNCKFMESSAKLGVNMDKIFRESVSDF